MRLLTLDQSITQTGWAKWDIPAERSPKETEIECGSFKCDEPADDYDKCELFATELRKLRTRFKPDFITWEMSSRKISAYPKRGDFVDEEMAARGQGRMVVNAKALLLPELQGIIRGVATAYLIPHEAVPVSSWRAKVFGKGGGAMTTDEAKRAAKRMCLFLKIAFSNHNEAEAAMLCLWTERCSQRFKMARWRQGLEAEAAATV